MNNRLYKDEILRGKIHFSRLFKDGKFLYYKNLNVLYLKKKEFKIGFAVSRKIKKSVYKNRIKRQLREIYRTNKTEFPKDIHIVIIVKKDNVNYDDLKKEVLATLKKIN